MGLQEDFARAVSQTEIHRYRHARLLTYGSTELPYLLLCESVVNLGDTVVRRGVVRVERPQVFLIRDPDPMEFEGFDEEEHPGRSRGLVTLGRIASFPPGKYSNIETELDIYEGSLRSAIAHYEEKLDQMQDDQTGLVSGPADVWALSLFVYVGSMVARSAPGDIQDFMRRFGPAHDG